MKLTTAAQNAMLGRKGFADFQRENEEFEARKRQRMLQEQIGGLQARLLEKKLTVPEHLEMEQILAKAIQGGGVESLSPAEQAQLQAYDITQRTKQSVDPRGNVITNRSIYDMLPNNAQASPPQMPGSYQDPMVQANRTAAASRAAELGQPDMPNARPPSIDPGSLEGFSPFVQEDLRAEAIKENMKLQSSRIKEDLEKKPAKQNFDKQLASVLDAVEELRDMGAGVSTGQSTVENISARARSTAPGQFTGQFLGTKEQALRDLIDSKRPVLFNAIKKASGLTGTELNSQFEVENQLKQLGNDAINIDTRIQILKDLSEQFGLGSVSEFRSYKPPKKEEKNSPPAFDPSLLEFMTPEERALFE